MPVYDAGPVSPVEAEDVARELPEVAEALGLEVASPELPDEEVAVGDAVESPEVAVPVHDELEDAPPESPPRPLPPDPE